MKVKNRKDESVGMRFHRVLHQIINASMGGVANRAISGCFGRDGSNLSIAGGGRTLARPRGKKTSRTHVIYST
jgi:hypothetical protein